MYNEIIASNIVNTDSVIVVFDMWGQRCETICMSEEDALKWLSTCASKGWLLAIEIVGYGGTVLYEGEGLRNLVDQ